MSFSDYVTAKQKTTGARLLRGMWCNILIGSVWVNDWTVEWQRGDGPGRGHHHHTVYTRVRTCGLANYIQCINQINTNYIQLSRLILQISIATHLCEEQTNTVSASETIQNEANSLPKLRAKRKLNNCNTCDEIVFFTEHIILVLSKTRGCLVCN